MGKLYYQDLHERVMAAAGDGLMAGEVAPPLRVSVSYIYKVLGRGRATGETTARPSLRRRREPKLADHEDALRRRVTDEPDATLAELRARLASDRGVGGSGASAACARNGSACRSKRRPRAAEQDRPHVAEARLSWRTGQAELNPMQLVFIDETAVVTNTTHRYGRCPRGRCLVAAVPHGHWQTTAFVAALRQDG